MHISISADMKDEKSQFKWQELRVGRDRFQKQKHPENKQTLPRPNPTVQACASLGSMPGLYRFKNTWLLEKFSLPLWNASSFLKTLRNQQTGAEQSN